MSPAVLVGADITAPAIGRDQDLAEAAAVGGADDATILHLVEDAGGAGIADPQATLEERGGGLVRATHDLDRLGQQRVAVVALLTGLASGLARSARRRHLGA